MSVPQINVLGVVSTVLVVYLVVPVATRDKACRPFSLSTPKGICGNDLNKALRFICGQDGYAKNGKRSELPALADEAGDLDVASLYKSVDMTGDFGEYNLDKKDASHFLGKRGRVQIICECCYNKCSIRELSGYCKNPAKAYARFSSYGSLGSRLFR